MFRWLADQLASGVLQYILPIVIAAAVTFIARYKFAWATPAMFGLLAMALVTVSIAAFNFQRSNRRSAVTPDNIEGKITEWTEYFKLASQRADLQDSYFARIFTVGINQKVLVARIRGRERFLELQGQLTLSPEHLEMFKSLTQTELEDFFDTLRLEAARAGVLYELQPPFTVFIKKTLLIRPDLTDLEFTNAIDAVVQGVEIFRNAIVIGLKTQLSHREK